VLGGAVVLLAGLTIRNWRLFIQLRDRLVREQEESRLLREQQQQALAEARSQQQALFNSMVEGVLLLDGNGRVQLANATIAQLFGLHRDIRGQTLIEAFRLDAVQRVFHRVLEDGQVLNEELVLPGPERKCLQINATAVLDGQGRRQGMILVLHDLTRLKELENTRKEFVANVSHELRTPLAMIKGYAETLLNGAKDDPQVATRFLQTIEKHADRLTYLIEDLLTMSRLESGQIVMNIQRTQLRSITDEVLGDLLVRASERNTRFENRVRDDLFVQADGDRLQQVLFNLVDNAIKYGRPGGEVILDAVKRDDRFVEMRVQDDGPGIPPDSLGRIFERFYRVDKARSREQGGTGLGLAIVKHIIQFHGGEVWAESHPGQGTAFFFTLRAEQ
jgi:two-component system phosphate regulon sensor histidine kinase PhoR